MKSSEIIKLKDVGPELAGTLQLYVPRPKKINEILKPTSGFMYSVTWTSTAQKLSDGTYTSAWVEWCKTEMPQWLSKGGALFRVKPGAKVLSMNTDKDAFKIAQHYGVQPPKQPIEWMSWSQKFPWDDIEDDYAGVHHNPSGSRLANILMSSWDVESTAWFNNNFFDYVGTARINL